MIGRRTENDAVVTVYEPPDRAVMQGTSGNAPFVATLSFAPDGDATRVEVTTEITFSGAMRILAPLVMSVYGRGWAPGLATLKSMMESGEL